MSTGKICTCASNFYVDVMCGICEKKSGEEKKECEIHRVIMFCGKPKQTCSTCKQRGLKIISGTGGPTYITDKNTGIDHYISDLQKKPLILNF
jgi:hypothetical protein